MNGTFSASAKLTNIFGWWPEGWGGEGGEVITPGCLGIFLKFRVLEHPKVTFFTLM